MLYTTNATKRGFIKSKYYDDTIFFCLTTSCALCNVQSDDSGHCSRPGVRKSLTLIHWVAAYIQADLGGVWVITQEIWQDSFYRKSVILTHAPVNYLNMTPDGKVGWGISIIRRSWRPYGWQHPLRMPWGRKRKRSLIFTRLTVGLIFTRVSGSFGRTTRVSIGPPLLNGMDSWKLLKTENTRIRVAQQVMYRWRLFA